MSHPGLPPGSIALSSWGAQRDAVLCLGYLARRGLVPPQRLPSRMQAPGWAGPGGVGSPASAGILGKRLSSPSEIAEEAGRGVGAAGGHAGRGGSQKTGPESKRNGRLVSLHT